MAKAIQQFRYYGDSQKDNVQYGDLLSGINFDYPVLQLGVQSLPGTAFYLNSNNNPVIIGSTGIFEIDLEGLVEISKITFNEASLDIIKNNINGYLLIDVLYEEED